MSKGKSISDEEKEAKKAKKKKNVAVKDAKKSITAKKVQTKSKKSTLKKAIQDEGLVSEIIIAREVVKQNTKTLKIDKKEEARQIPEDFEQYYEEQVKPKLEKFSERHDQHSIASTSLEILFVDIFSEMEKHKFIEEGKFAEYTKPQREEKVRATKVRREEQGFFGRLLGRPPKIITEVTQEKYMAEAPSKFKRDVEDNIIVYTLSNDKDLDLDLADLTHHMAKEMLNEMNEPDHANEASRFARKGSSQQIETAQNIYETDRETFQKKYEAKIVHSHNTEPMKIEAAQETPETATSKSKGSEKSY